MREQRMKIEKAGDQSLRLKAPAVDAATEGNQWRPGRRLLPNPHRQTHLRVLIFAVLAVSVLAQGPKPASPKSDVKAASIPVAPAGTHEITADDVGTFLDGIMPQQLAREDVAGAVVSVVKDGKLLFAKGYGYSDVEKKTPVTADSTLFRPGSISKLFTWTAVMQLVEQGRLDLDRD